MAAAGRWIDSHPESSVRNSQPAGIGRLAVFGSRIVVNNLGKNIVVSRLERGRLQVDGVFDQTMFEDSDELSQFDLDMHSFLYLSGDNLLLAINHHGLVRGFPLDDPPTGRLTPTCLWSWCGDVESMVLAGNSLVGTSPLGYASSDGFAPGIVISDPLVPRQARHDSAVSRVAKNAAPAGLQGLPALAEWGRTSGLCLGESHQCLAVLAGSRVGLFPLSKAMESAVWTADLPFAASWIDYDALSRAFVVSGHRTYRPVPGGYVDFSGWFGCEAGVIDGATGELLQHFQLGVELAWGNGSVPLSRRGDLIFGTDSAGGIYRWCLSEASPAQVRLRDPDDSCNLGFAHLAICERYLLCGYNRGGYKLLVLDLDA